jgi:hypothetical protein
MFENIHTEYVDLNEMQSFICDLPMLLVVQTIQLQMAG